MQRVVNFFRMSYQDAALLFLAICLSALLSCLNFLPHIENLPDWIVPIKTGLISATTVFLTTKAWKASFAYFHKRILARREAARLRDKPPTL